MDAERPERHADAERRTIVELPFLTLQRGNAYRDALRNKFRCTGYFPAGNKKPTLRSVF
ncbi:DUF1534 domain-containing protein [Pseudomonas amygdali pv. lachrymans str. M301315]|uniref:DUF1534 domain-containing protein n=2 Tax=Pseudomonas amygdali pv. lachrymans TaxID=53707 RepID=A0ABR5KYZ5_PSEAV|nr:DUF1534 domain-containing protein [Pseudomonas amygdali pv. lachrymans str. M301315]KPC20753.1 Unknown protein sequence [Pseudomonas amygdali pv. lachrymans]PWD00945.1 hypothetical protein CX658_23665 [Pseudomonas amygdali pv. lachrymans]